MIKAIQRILKRKQRYYYLKTQSYEAIYYGGSTHIF